VGGFLGIGNSSAKTDRGQTLKGYGELGNIFNFGLNQATSTASAASSALQGPQAYWASILSGNRPAMQQAVAPETNAVNAAGDAQRRQQEAMGTARGGGTASANQTAETGRMAQIDNLLMQARPEAAKESARVGETELADSINALGVTGNAASNLTAISADSRKTSIQANNQIQQQIGGIIEGVLMGLP
jgi:hypothetical protein